MARAQLVFLRRLSGTHHVSQRLVRGVGDPHRRQVTLAVAARQLQGIAPIRLHAIAGFIGTKVGATTSHRTPSAVSCQ